MKHKTTISAQLIKNTLPRLPNEYPLSLKANSLVIFVGNVVYASSQWGIISILAKFGTPQAVAKFGLGLAVSAPLIFLTNLSLRPVLATDARREYSFSVYFTLRLFATFLFALLLIGVIPIFSHNPETWLVILLVGLAKAIESISDINYGLFQQRERLDRVAISMGLRGGLAVVGVIFIMWLTQSLFLSVVWIMLAWLSVLLLFDIPQSARFATIEIVPVSKYKSILWDLVKTSFPLGITMMLISLKSNIPKYFIVHAQGEKYLGFFVALNYLFVAGNMVNSSLGQASSPRLASYFAKKLSRPFWKLMGKMLFIGFLLSLMGFVLALFFGKSLLEIVYTSEYAQFTDVLIWLSVAAGIGYLASFWGYAATAVWAFRSQPVILIISVVVLVFGLLFWLPAYGLIGVAWAMMVSYVTQGVGFLIVTFWAWRSSQIKE